MERCGSELDLPGFRFHPTEDELLEFYLRRAASGEELKFDIIGTLNLYLHEPWDLPSLAKTGEREWYFFVPRERRQRNGWRPNRTTERGFWKATGSDRHIRSTADYGRLIGLRKTLVYYRGRAPRGTKTDWVMNEYRLPNSSPAHSSMADIVLCKVHRKTTPLIELEQMAAMKDSQGASQGGTVSANSSEQENSQAFPCDLMINMEIKEEFEDVPVEKLRDGTEVTSTPAVLHPVLPLLESIAVELQPILSESLVIHGSSKVEETPAWRQPLDLPARQVPSHTSFDVVDPFMNQLRSPWLDQMWSPVFANLNDF